MLIFDILGRHPAAFQAFYAGLSDRHKLALAALARLCGDEGLCYTLILDVRRDPDHAPFLSGLAEGLRRGEPVFEELAIPAATAVFDHFAVEDYRGLDHAQQAAVAQRFLTHPYSWHIDGQPTQRRLIAALDIPQPLIDRHFERLEAMQRAIILAPYGTVYDIPGGPGGFASLSRDDRLTLARAHVDMLSALYHVSPPFVEANDDGSMVGDAHMSSAPLGPNEYRPVIVLNGAGPNTSLNGPHLYDFLDTVSHEFAHYLESLMVAGPGSHLALVARDGMHSNGPWAQSDHFLHDQAISAPFVANSEYFSYMAAGGYESRFVMPNESYDGYMAQIKERHARWFGGSFSLAFCDAAQVRQRLQEPEAYRQDLLQAFGDARWSLWWSRWFSHAQHDELYEFLHEARRELKAMDTGDREAFCRRGAALMQQACDLIDRDIADTQDMPDSLRAISAARRRELWVMQKAVDEWLPAARSAQPPAVMPTARPAPF